MMSVRSLENRHKTLYNFDLKIKEVKIIIIKNRLQEELYILLLHLYVLQ